MSRTVRGWKSLAEAMDRAVTTVREWPGYGCPYVMDGNVHVFDLDLVEQWQDNRERTAGTPEDNSELRHEQIRKLRLECSKLEYDAENRELECLPVDQIEPAWNEMFGQLRVIAIETFDSIKTMAHLSEVDARSIDKQVMEGLDLLAAPMLTGKP